MTLQEQIVDAWEIAASELRVPERISINVSFSVGLLTGCGFPHAAMFVLALGQDKLGPNHPDMVELRRKLGLDR